MEVTRYMCASLFIRTKKPKLNLPVKVTEMISAFHRRRQSPPHPHMSMTNRQRAAKVSTLDWTSVRLTEHPYNYQLQAFNLQEPSKTMSLIDIPLM